MRGGWRGDGRVVPLQAVRYLRVVRNLYSRRGLPLSPTHFRAMNTGPADVSLTRIATTMMRGSSRTSRMLARTRSRSLFRTGCAAAGWKRRRGRDRGRRTPRSPEIQQFRFDIHDCRRRSTGSNAGRTILRFPISCLKAAELQDNRLFQPLRLVVGAGLFRGLTFGRGEGTNVTPAQENRQEQPDQPAG